MSYTGNQILGNREKPLSSSMVFIVKQDFIAKMDNKSYFFKTIFYDLCPNPYITNILFKQPKK